MLMQVFSKNELIAEVVFDPIAQVLQKYTPYSSDILELPFGACRDPGYDCVYDFLESRSPDATRCDIKSLLNNWGLDVYD